MFDNRNDLIRDLIPLIGDQGVVGHVRCIHDLTWFQGIREQTSTFGGVFFVSKSHGNFETTRNLKNL